MPRYLARAVVNGEWPSAPSEAVSPGAAENANSVFSARPMRPRPGLTSLSLASATTPRPEASLAPNGSLRQASRMISPTLETALTVARTSSSGRLDALSAFSDDASASTGSSRFSPPTSTPCPAKKTSATSAPLASSRKSSSARRMRRRSRSGSRNTSKPSFFSVSSSVRASLIALSSLRTLR